MPSGMTAARSNPFPPTTVRPVVERRSFKWRGALGVVLLTPAIIITILATPVVDPMSWLAIVIDALAWISFVAGAGLRFWATLYIGGRKSDEVVEEGPYSLCRHPLYLGSVLLFLSGALFLQSLIMAGALALLATAYFAFTVPAEEEYLADRLGSAYREYCRRVNRFWPSIRGFRSPRKLTVDVHSLYVEWARASRWLWLPILGEVIQHLRAMPWWPRWVILP